MQLSPGSWKDYELIDVGDFLKLERFGDFITIRPEPQAMWAPGKSIENWIQKAHVQFIPKSSSTGHWKKLRNMPDQWSIRYPLGGHTLVFRLGLTSFKHVGIFPEQAANWDYIYQQVKSMNTPQPRVLNLFAYTGGASLAARLAGAEVTHVDSIRQVITWARQNMELSGITDIRWVVEDAFKFVKREAKRGNHYHGIILDPPAYGHGPDGEKWKLEEMLGDLMAELNALLHKQEYFLLLNAYSLGLSPMIAGNLLKQLAPQKISYGELFIPSSTGFQLPLGIFGRAEKQQTGS